MANPGLSLVGFMDEQAALQHLRFVCKPADPAEAELRATWQAARAQLGPPTPNAGNPDIQPIPAEHAAHLANVRQQPWVAALFNNQWAGADFRLVAIAQLLAFQHAVDLARSSQHCGNGGNQPTLEDIVRICLPPTLDPITPQVLPAPSPTAPTSLLVSTRNGNLRVARAGGFINREGNNVVGIEMGVAPSLVHVVRLGGRYYVHNGYHRCVALMRAGATHVACVVREVATAADAGIRDDGGTFSVARLTSPDPPTIAHYADGRAMAVSLRRTTRLLHVSWSEYLVPEDD